MSTARPNPVGSGQPELPALEEMSHAKSARRPWSQKFRDAFRGVKAGIRGHASFFVHFFVAALVLAAALAFRCAVWEWCVLLGCIGMVLTAELFNSAIETIFRDLPAEPKPKGFACLDIAAGAVLLASATAAVVGGLVFLPHALDWFP